MAAREATTFRGLPTPVRTLRSAGPERKRRQASLAEPVDVISCGRRTGMRRASALSDLILSSVAGTVEVLRHETFS